MDITDRKNTESRLAESYQELEALYGELVTKEIELNYSSTTPIKGQLFRAVKGVTDWLSQS
jgi:hypothetical protein